jgi:hypothetical protein
MRMAHARQSISHGSPDTLRSPWKYEYERWFATSSPLANNKVRDLGEVPRYKIGLYILCFSECSNPILKK